jgi:hypothetical protein
MVANIESNMWERVVSPWDDLSPEAADALLRLRFPQRDIDRMNELAALARDGQLTPAQSQELELYNRVGHMLAVVQSKARMALKKPAGR